MPQRQHHLDIHRTTTKAPLVTFIQDRVFYVLDHLITTIIVIREVIENIWEGWEAILDFITHAKH